MARYEEKRTSLDFRRRRVRTLSYAPAGPSDSMAVRQRYSILALAPPNLAGPAPLPESFLPASPARVFCSLRSFVKEKTPHRVPAVLQAMSARWNAAGKPTVGWVFPTESASGHLEESTAKIQHSDAIKKINAAKAAYDEWNENGREGDWQPAVASAANLERDYVSRHAETLRAGLKPFPPYCLRHTALTHLAESGCDAFTLARIAGHSSITITQRYCHPQRDAIESAFKKLSAGEKVVNDGGQHAKMLPAPEAQPSL